MLLIGLLCFSCALPEDSKEVPEIWVDRKDFKGAGDISFGEPSSVAYQVNEFDGMVSISIMHGEVWSWDDTVNAWKVNECERED